MTRRPRGRWWFAPILAAAGLAAALAAAEGLLRVSHPLLSRDLKVVWIRSQLMRHNKLHRVHPELLWAPAPGLTLRYPSESRRWRLAHVGHDGDPNAGYRADAPIRDARLLVLGDSFTYGFEVDQDDTWVERLRRAAGVTAVNLAVTSYGTSQEAAVYRLFGGRFRHDLVVQVIAANDPLDNVFFNEVNPRKDPRIVNLCWFIGAAQGGAACRTALWAVNNTVLGGIVVFQLQAYAKRRWDEDPLMRRGTEMICEDVRSVAALAKRRKARYAAVMTGHWTHRRLSGLRARLESCLDDAGVPWLELDELAEARRRGRPMIGRFDWHWNEEGHAYVAAKIEAFLREKKLLPPVSSPPKAS